MPVARRRLILAAALTALVTAFLTPLTCSQSSAEERPRCETAFGYRTPVSEAGGQVLLVVIVGLLAAAAVRRRPGRR